MERRDLLKMMGCAAGLAPVQALASEAVFPGKPTTDTPTANVIKGTPSILDFGDGLEVPCDKSAFLTLWEGKTFWLTMGAGRADYLERAQGMAVLYAMGAMKLLLMTLAFTPERMAQKDGGWRLKEQAMSNYVLGDIFLPGHPYWPINDAQFLGSDDLGTENSTIAAAGSDAAPGAASGPNQGGSTIPPDALAFPSGLNKVNAYTSYIVLKRDVSLDMVRNKAQILLR